MATLKNMQKRCCKKSLKKGSQSTAVKKLSNTGFEPSIATSRFQVMRNNHSAKLQPQTPWVFKLIIKPMHRLNRWLFSYLRSACGLKKECGPVFALRPFIQRAVNDEPTVDRSFIL